MKFLIVGILTLSLFGCGQKQSENQYRLTYIDGNKKIELIFENGKEFLILDKPTKANIITENIDSSNIMIVGVDIRRIVKNNSEYQWEITPRKRHLTDGKQKIIIRVIENGASFESGEKLDAVFLVDVKDSE